MRLRIPAALLLAVALLAGGSTAALAHTEVRSTTPKRGGAARSSLASVTVTFSQPVRSGTLRVTGPGGRRVSLGRGARDPRDVARLRVELARGLRAGRYRASWTIEAADGHAQRGTFSFRVRS